MRSAFRPQPTSGLLPAPLDLAPERRAVHAGHAQVADDQVVPAAEGKLASVRLLEAHPSGGFASTFAGEA